MKVWSVFISCCVYWGSHINCLIPFTIVQLIGTPNVFTSEATASITNKIQSLFISRNSGEKLIVLGIYIRTNELRFCPTCSKNEFTFINIPISGKCFRDIDSSAICAHTDYRGVGIRSIYV